MFKDTDCFTTEDMLSFGNFIRDNYYPDKYPHGTIEDIFVYWCIAQGKE